MGQLLTSRRGMLPTQVGNKGLTWVLAAWIVDPYAVEAAIPVDYLDRRGAAVVPLARGVLG
jgi:hypothetical protein